jgi:ornithine cyclodeaminase/alanine dehydrogenase-like protein (mu-crystallin family)
MPHLLVLSESDVRALLDLDALVEAMATALAEFSSGRAVQPTRHILDIGPARNVWFGVMPAALPAANAAGAKLVTVRPPHPTVAHTHQAMIALVDPETGTPAALLDGRYVTEMRTAAVSALAVRALASRAPARIGILGAGIQARSHIALLGRSRHAEIRVWSPSERRHALVREAKTTSPAQLHAVDTAEDAVRDADVVILVTASNDPVVRRAWVANGALVVSVGACRPMQREMDPALVADADLFVDSLAAALVESGDIVQGIAEGRFDEGHIRGELGEVVSGAVAAPRDPARIAVFKSLGMGVEDVAAAALVLESARAKGAGTVVEI